MPGFKSHYLFGRNALKTFTLNNDEQYLYRYPQSFNIGLQGPDVFFYYAPAWLIYEKNIGNVIHSNKTLEFFHALIDARNNLLKKEHRRIADAYISGFIAHYTLDSIVHPYIYYRTKNKDHKDRALFDFGIHVFLETDIDNALLRHYDHIKPTDFAMGDTIKLSLTENTVISIVLYNAIKETFPDNKTSLLVIRQALKAMATESNLMRDPKGIKKWGVRMLERCVTGHAVISGMIPSDKVITYKDPCNLRHKRWVNPWNESDEHTDSVYDLIDKATPLLEERLHYYSKAQSLSMNISDADKGYSLEQLYESLGDCSYLSGL